MAVGTCLNVSFERPTQPRRNQVLHSPSQNTVSCPQDFEDGSSTTTSHMGQMHLAFAGRLEVDLQMEIAVGLFTLDKTFDAIGRT